jgi:hypothetical protein
MQTQTAAAQTVLEPAAADPLIRRMLALVIIALGLGLTGVWISLLAYGLITLLMLAF